MNTKPIDTNKPYKKTKKVPFQSLIDAQMSIITGSTPAQAAKEVGMPTKLMEDRLSRVNEVLSSNTPALTVERQLISEALSDKLKPIKEELAIKSLEIIREADKIVLQRLQGQPEELKMKDVLKASEQHSQRIARITGLEEDPEVDPSKAGLDRAKTINFFVNNTFKNHLDKLKEERVTTNTIDVTPTIIKNEEKETKSG